MTKSATEVQRVLKNHVKENYTLKAKLRNEAFSKTRTTQNNMTAFVRITGSPNEVADYLHKYSRENGVTFRIRTASQGGKQLDPKPFWAKFKSGHEAVAQRVVKKASSTDEEYATEAIKEDRRSRHLDTTKIKVLFGNSVPKMLNSKKSPIEEKVDLELIVRQKMEETIQKVIENAAKE